MPALSNRDLPKQVPLINWDCRDADTQYYTHAIHRYSGKFIPQIARQAIELLSSPGDLVLDPYCGSGTTLLECCLTGRRSVGIDLNPLAVLIAQVKTTPMPGTVLADVVRRFEARLVPLARGPEQPGLFSPVGRSSRELVEKAHADRRWTDPWYCKWFKDEARLELIAVHQAITEEEQAQCRDLALVAFSDVVRRSSNANNTYPNIMFDRSKKGVSPPVTPRFLARLREIAEAIGTLDGLLSPEVHPAVLRADARRLPIQDASVDAVVTHPPYVGSIPYAEYGSLSLVWLGYSPRDIDAQLTGGRRQSRDVVDRFRDGFCGMLKESQRVLKPAGMLFMLLGNPTVRGQQVNLADMARDCALPNGFELVTRHHRNGVNRRANLMGSEDLLFLRKSAA